MGAALVVVLLEVVDVLLLVVVVVAAAELASELTELATLEMADEIDDSAEAPVAVTSTDEMLDATLLAPPPPTLVSELRRDWAAELTDERAAPRELVAESMGPPGWTVRVVVWHWGG